MRLCAVCFAFAMMITRVVAGAPPASDLDVLRGSAGENGFARALEPRVFEFPRDAGPHPEFRHEWWYVTGNVDSTAGERFGFELTFFRVALVPPKNSAAEERAPAVAGTRSAWRTQQIYLAHFAVTDVARREFHFAQKASRGALGLAGAQAEPFRVWLDDWKLEGSPGSPDWSLQARGQGYELKLHAHPLSPPVLNGEGGLSKRSPTGESSSYYYSIPRIAVDGRLLRGNASADVRGLAWLDREWGSGSLRVDQQGWDWFAFQFQDGGSLMFYSLRERSGARDPISAGTWVDAAGQAHALNSGQVEIEVTNHWVSPRGGRYPSGWRVRVPMAGLDVKVRPVLADQELGTRPRYWEGAVDLVGSQGDSHAAGRGYVELTGYGE